MNLTVILPYDIVSYIIIRYLSIHDNKCINKCIEKQRKLIIANKCQIINKQIYNYISEFREEMDNDYYYIPKYTYKKFYPLNFRLHHMELFFLKCKNHDKTDYIRKLYNYSVKYKTIVDVFNIYIDELSDYDLYTIGW